MGPAQPNKYKTQTHKYEYVFNLSFFSLSLMQIGPKKITLKFESDVTQYYAGQT